MSKKFHFNPRLLGSVLVFLLLFGLFYRNMNSVSENTSAEQKRSLEEALNRNIVHCYITNGFYPESLEYLMSNYPIAYDDSLFIIHYQPVAANLMPDVTVIERK